MMKSVLVIAYNQSKAREWFNKLFGGAQMHRMRVLTPHINPMKIRGLSESHTAIVWVEDVEAELSKTALDILDIYKALGVPEISRTDVQAVRQWMRS